MGCVAVTIPDLGRSLHRRLGTLARWSAFSSDRWYSHDPRRMAMDWNRVEGNWKQIKGKVKQQWGKLTDDDLDVIAGKQDQLEGMIQQRDGYQKDQAKKEVNDWYARQPW
jgi:uncharacterized protein YjbJ (UPF0337 family)